VAHNPYEPPKANLERPLSATSSSGSASPPSLGPRIILALAWLAFCGSYTIWAGLKQHSWFAAGIGAVVVFATFGVFRLWHWAQWIVYAFVIVSTGAWVYTMWDAVRAGAFPMATPALTALALVPGLSIFFASIWSADVVRRRFRK
jgi:hypothetical protein